MYRVRETVIESIACETVIEFVADAWKTMSGMHHVQIYASVYIQILVHVPHNADACRL